MGLFDRLFQSEHVQNLSDEEKAELELYSQDREGWTQRAKGRIVQSHVKKQNEQTVEYYDAAADDSSGSDDYTPTDYSQYQEGLDD